MSGRHGTAATPRLGGPVAVVLFIFTLFAFVAESQLTQYVQTSLGFRQPFLLLYIVHSAFSIIFPLHFLYLRATSQFSSRTLFNGLSMAVTSQLSKHNHAEFPSFAFLRLILALSVGINFPALMWFAAISLASVSDVTAIWNTNAFFAYIITVKLFNLKWEPRRLAAVLLATLGVLAVIYGGSHSPLPGEAGSGSKTLVITTFRPRAPLVGDILTLIAAVGYGFYQVLYKKYAALPNDPEHAAERDLYTQLPGSSSPDDLPSIPRDVEDATYPLPFGLHPNLLTSLIGLSTFLVLWIPLPFLHWMGIEPFMFPKNWTTVLAIVGIALNGVLYNAGFMILIGVWGPIIASVGNLLTIVLVFLSDVYLGGLAETVTVWSILGSGVIVAAFGVLAYDMFQAQ